MSSICLLSMQKDLAYFYVEYDICYVCYVLFFFNIFMSMDLNYRMPLIDYFCHPRQNTKTCCWLLWILVKQNFSSLEDSQE